jgi:hypothetical protein
LAIRTLLARKANAFQIAQSHDQTVGGYIPCSRSIHADDSGESAHFLQSSADPMLPKTRRPAHGHIAQ